MAENVDGQVTHQGKNLYELTKRLVRDADQANEVLASLKEMLDHINKGKGAVGAVVKKDELHAELIKTVKQLNESLNEMAKTAESIRKRWGL